MNAELQPLAEFLDVNRAAELLCGQQEHYHCLRSLFERNGETLEFCAHEERAFRERYGAMLSKLQVTGLDYAPFWGGRYFGPDMSQFQVLIASAPDDR
jgi:hypothetical protein